MAQVDTGTGELARVVDSIRVEALAPGYKTWQLLDSFEWRLGSSRGSERVVVEAGFITDFASIPRPLWWLWPPSQGPYLPATLVHDCLYKTAYVTHRFTGKRRVIGRAEADYVMLDIMNVCETPLATQRGLYRGVRLGGWLAWRRHRKAERHE